MSSSIDMISVEKTALADIANMAHVTRWHAMNVHRKQSVAEHTTLVTIYAHVLLQRIYPDHSAEEAMKVILDALYRDAPEAVVGGDIPTPLKRLMEEGFEDGESPLDQLERKLCPEHHKYRSAIEGTPLYSISKLADILEAQHFIMIEGKPPQGQQVFEMRGKAFRDLVESSRSRWPELIWDEAYSVQKELLYGTGYKIQFKEKFQR